MKTLGWGGASPLRRAALLVATGFGLGLSPVASGTVGTLPGVAVVLISHPAGWLYGALFAAVLALLAVPVCDVAETHFASKDDGRIVADEYLTFPLTVIAVPWPAHPVLLLGVAFVTHRVMDILKPFPAHRLQRLPGGLGIVADDAVSSLYALGLNHLFCWYVLPHVPPWM